MRKEEAIKRINNIGFAGWIVALIAKIFLFIAIAATVVGLVLVLALVPQGFITMRGGGEGEIIIDLAAIGREMTDEDYTAYEVQANYFASHSSVMADGAVFSMNAPKIDGNRVIFDWSFAGREDEIAVDVHNLWAPLFATSLFLGMALVSVFFISALCKAFRYCASPFDTAVITKMRNLAFSLIPWTVMSNIADNLWSNMLQTNPMYSFHLTINLGMIVVVLIVLALTYIFKYGAVLQQESDETL